jgi:major membrane immunogen (membrane-anchored lipoprotein)
MKRWYWIVTVLIMVSVFLLGACSGGDQTPEPESPDGKALLEARCTQCHGLSKITNKQKTQEQWQQTVTQMVEKGAQLNADEQATLVAYLAETYAP